MKLSMKISVGKNQEIFHLYKVRESPGQCALTVLQGTMVCLLAIGEEKISAEFFSK